MRTPERTCTRRVAAAMAVLAAALLAGCNGNKRETAVPEFLSRDALIARYDARAEAIQTLWSRCHIEARIAKLDDQGRPVKDKFDTYSLDGNLILRKPRDLYLVGKAFGDPQFGLQSNDKMYWLWIKPGESVEYYGRYGGPGETLFPVRPGLLLEALAIYPLPGDLRLFKRGDETDVLQTQGVELEGAGRSGQVNVMPYVIQEIFLERVHHDPVEVRIYDRRGEPLLVSHLSRYEEVDGQRVPMEIVYHFVPVDWTFTLSLHDVSLTREIKDAAFERRPQGFEHTVDLDAEAARPPATPQE